MGMHRYLFSLLFVLSYALLAPVPSAGQGLSKIPRGVKALGNTPATTIKVTNQALTGKNAVPVDIYNPAHLSTTVSRSVAKHILNQHTTYIQGKPHALQAIRDIQKYGTLHLEEDKQFEILEQLESFINDPYLKEFVWQNMINEDYAAMLQDLADYYNLTTEFITTLDPGQLRTEKPEDVFIQTTLNYLKRHPHKPTVQLREILKNPEVGPRFKQPINWIISHPPEFLEEKEQTMIFWLRSAYREHARSLAKAHNAREVQITAGFYKQALQELTTFANTHHRAPRWDGPMPERRLYNQLLVIMNDNQANFFTEVNQSVQGIQKILDTYPVITLSEQETLVQLEQFMKEHGFYPRSYDKTKGHTTEEELILRDHIRYYSFRNSELFNQIEDLGKKYHISL